MFEYEEKSSDDKVLVLIIYDIVENKARMKLAKYLQGYGFQKSAFEAVISKASYNKLLRDVKKYISSEDSLRIYKIIGKGQVTTYGKAFNCDSEEIIII